MAAIDCAGKSLDLSHPCVMGIINVTPDSFSDGGDFLTPGNALIQARRMVGEGADIIDVGGESTRPGAMAVSQQQELDRVIPIISAISAEFPIPVSIDTTKAAVMREAVAAGAGFINDVMALRAPGAVDAASSAGVPVCLIHMQGEPRSMQQDPCYQDVVTDVKAFFASRIEACLAGGISRDRLLLDPGFGFGKALEHNLDLLNNLSVFVDMGLPLLVGVSRKSMIGMILGGNPVRERLHGSIAAAVMAFERGASILRVHDVRPTVEALKVVAAVRDR